MTLLEVNKHCTLFYKVTGLTIEIHGEYHSGLLESAYETALVYLLYLLNQQGLQVNEQVNLPMYRKNERLPKSYCMDLVIGNDTIVELKAGKYVTHDHRRQLWNYMNLTHMPFGLLFNFGAERLFGEWYYCSDNEYIIKLIWQDNRLKDFDKFLK